ncbi:5'-nucleotidase C-terminal domain-containing protein [Christiangramia sediminis]|uniref:5'-nucleotidase C-terminal domain-containing protein n=1 Tax=Christiangramia sediminis TaxID=2881336 RepID=A0A9X1LG42_9FLAO|nr:5'-nucleotidase [Christiangramia sediminis]MCB7479663.1 5'-nucleotidase C-terminal domain-containing protein [Christiangramia sediminis]
MKLSKLLLLASTVFILSCKTEKTEVARIDTQRIAVDNSFQEDSQISEFISPYKEHLNATLDSALAYNPSLLSKNEGELNTAIGNLMADAVLIQANPVFRKRTGKNIDMVLLNHGGIRAVIPAGKVTSRTAYQIMPFENEIVIAELTGKKIKEMLKYLEKAKTAHPVSGIKILADKNYKTIKATINEEEIEDDMTYFVATSDYLVNGGDNMNFFKDPVNLYGADYKIRNAMIDYFKKTDTIKAKIDDRYIKE